jgi:copper(I)-binding protein
LKLATLLTALVLSCFAYAAGSGVRVNGVWSRATPPGSTVGVVYARITAAQADALLSITTPAADRVEIHLSSNEGGIMKMRPATSVTLPAGKPVQLEPGGLHVMLIGLHAPLQAGTSFALTLRFRSAAPLTVFAQVIAPGDAEPAH